MILRRISTKFGIVLAALFSAVLALALVPYNALAADAPQARAIGSGDCGNCTWELDDDGALTIAPKDGTDGKLASFDIPDPWTFPQYASHVISVDIKPDVKANDSLFGMFSPCTNLETADLSNLDTSQATDMESMFGGCNALTSLNISGFNTSNVTKMNGMFTGCASLKSLDLSGFDTDKVESMHAMFDGCSALEELDLSSFNTKSATDMGNLFDGCNALKKVTVGADFSFKGSGATSCTLPEGNWLSSKDNKVYTAEEIAQGRNGIADTYTKDGVPVVEETPEPGSDAVEGETVYRLYNPNTGQHFFTANEYEREVLIGIGWSNEYVAWISPWTGANVYRLYNPNSGDHFFTTNAYERDVLSSIGWSYEGVAWHSDETDNVPLYRLFNPNAKVGSHLWTASSWERHVLVGLGWQAEGIGWYALAE